MTLYSLGSNGSGQLGIGHLEDVSVPTPHELPLKTSIDVPVAIRAGGNHTLILTAGDSLYLSGATTYSEKRSLARHSKQPGQQTILVAQNVRLCTATWEATFYVQGNDIYSYGKGDRGELGREDAADSRVEIPIPNPPPHRSPRIIDLASGVQHTVVVLDNGEVWGWGNGRKGQLGEGHDIVYRPRKVRGLDFKVARAVCGREFTFLVGDPAEGRCFVLGSDKWGVVSQAPASVPGWKDIGACWGSVAVLLESGRIVSWGRSDHGQLAPVDLPAISKIACGSEHCLALAADSRVLAWGWGEHGNCGREVDRDHDVKNCWVELNIPGPEYQYSVVGIGAGCATSWIWTLPKGG